MLGSWERLMIVALAGAVGASCRYLVGETSKSWDWGMALPFIPTLFVNLVGSFIFGLVVELGTQFAGQSPVIRLAILTGFLGSFTTFSAYSFDTLALLESRGIGWAAGYVLAQNAGGIGLAFLGVQTGRLVAP